MLVVGTRPNFMKIAPIAHELSRRGDRFWTTLAHTGQHFDREMSAVFLAELGLEEPDHWLDVGAGTHGQQIARVVERLEPILLDLKPDLVLVPGDVNSTLGAALAATAAGVPVGHVEAGLRSFDRTMPEEVNRVVVDAVSALHFIHSPEAHDNLVREGCDPSTVHYVGNTMIDTLTTLLPWIEQRNTPGAYGLVDGDYLVVTLHRPALVDGPLLLSALHALEQVSREYVVVFPVHPRTRAAMQGLGVSTGTERFRLLPPLGYLDFLGLVNRSAGVVTDSGGIQEETTFLGVPCFTLRDRTERPITVEMGTNVVLGLDPDGIVDVPRLISDRIGRTYRIPPLWDGDAACRLVDVLEAADELSVPPSEERLIAVAHELEAHLAEG
jgi:UDP-N-acetylglucosamine 2-epimerase (non-hydrolysing)